MEWSYVAVWWERRTSMAASGDACASIQGLRVFATHIPWLNGSRAGFAVGVRCVRRSYPALAAERCGSLLPFDKEDPRQLGLRTWSGTALAFVRSQQHPNAHRICGVIRHASCLCEGQRPICFERVRCGRICPTRRRGAHCATRPTHFLPRG